MRNVLYLNSLHFDSILDSLSYYAEHESIVCVIKVYVVCIFCISTMLLQLWSYLTCKKYLNLLAA